MSSNSLTDNDRKILAAAWHCFESQPKVNYNKLAEIMGYKTAASASACFNATKKKFLSSADANGDGTPAPTPKKGGKAKGKGKGKRAAADDDDDEDMAQTKSKKAKAAEEGELEASEDGEVGVKDEASDAE